MSRLGLNAGFNSPSKVRRHPRYFGCVPLISVLLLSACSIPGIRWQVTDTKGPPLTSGQSTKQVRRCDVVTAQSPWASNGGFSRCDIAFRSDDGVQISAFEVQRDVSASLALALPLRPLLQQFRAPGRASNGLPERYTLYVVALNPIVVVGMPNKPGEAIDSGPGWTKSFTAAEYYQSGQRYVVGSYFTVFYNTHPPVRNDSFFLVPSWQIASVPLSTEMQTATFSEKGITITLVQRSNTWQISGSKP